MRWLVRRDDEAIEAMRYGDIIQTMVAADSEGEARRLGAELMDCTSDDLTSTPYQLGAEADDAAQ